MAVDAIPSPRPAPAGEAAPGRTWWLEPVFTVIAYSTFVVYATWSVFIGTRDFFADPYLSPFYSPQFGFIRTPIGLALPVLAVIPLALRVTCYYYRKSYFRSFFWDPPACTVRELCKGRYTGETRFPLVLNNYHRYFLILTIIVVLFLWADVVRAFIFDGSFGIGLGSLVMLANVILLSLYTFSCHSLRHLAGGHLDCYTCVFAGRVRHRLAAGLNRLNPSHGVWAWTSMFSVALTDVYIRLVATGILHEPRWIS